MNDVTFWEKVRKRRNLFYLWWLGFLPIGVFFLGAPATAGDLFFYIWGAVWLWTLWRLKQLRCPRCGKPAIGNPFFFMDSAFCKHCGFTNSTNNNTQDPTVE
jgi:hypothetical protein